jgi:NTE family protein
MPISRALILSGGGGRGAYQAGVWAWLEEQGWRPDLVCGSSVGAINGAAIASGMPADRLRAMWQSIHEEQIFRPRRWRNFLHSCKRILGISRGFTPLADTAPLRDLLMRELDLQALSESDMELVVTAVRIRDAAVRYFRGSEIGIEHIMASSAIPVIFPWQEIDGEPHWDGGVAVNTPLLPALERGAREILVVLFAPLVRGGRAELPRTRLEALAWTFELATVGSAESVVSLLRTLRGEGPLGNASELNGGALTIGPTRFLSVAPAEPMGMRSLLRFEPEHATRLFEAGYRDARDQLGEL